MGLVVRYLVRNSQVSIELARTLLVGTTQNCVFVKSLFVLPEGDACRVELVTSFRV